MSHLGLMRWPSARSPAILERPVARDPGRRQRLLDVAKRHFTERGFLGTRLDDVAAEAGCAKGAIYLEFDDKETLLREVIEQTFAHVMERFTREVVVLPSPLDRLRETLRFAYTQHLAEPLFGRLLRDDPEFRFLRHGREDEWKAETAGRVAMVAAWVEEGITRGEIREDLDREAIPAVLGLLRVLPQHLGLVASAGQVSGERILDAMVDVFAAGLSARSVSSTRPSSASLTTPRGTDRRRERRKRAN
jgi:TetR/AcrR family transcriptional regulator, cholesterol catabolism regulator